MQQLASEIHLFHQRNERSQQLVRQMEVQILSRLHITAMGLVNVDLNLVPTVNNSNSSLAQYCNLYYESCIFSDDWYLPHLHNCSRPVQIIGNC